jgi:hypothetical protein
MKTLQFCYPRLNSGIIGRAATLLVIFSFSALISAQTGSVNFSGTWAFNESKSSPSEGGFRFAPSQLVITQNGVDLSVESARSGPDGSDSKSTAKYTTDGKECSNTAFGDNVRKSVVKWSSDGKSLVFSHTMSFNGNEMKTSETWKLTDGKTLSVESSFTTPDGEMKSTNVYDKK